MSPRPSLHGPAALASALVIVFLAAPAVTLVLRALGLGALGSAIADPAVRAAFVLTFVCATSATAIGAVLGVPLGYLLARREFPGKRWVEAVLDLPVVIPHPVAGIALLLVFGRATALGRAATAAGLPVVSAPLGIIVCMLFVSLPFMVNGARDGFIAVDPRLEAVARTLGAGPLATALRISLPLAARAIVSGAVLMWARAVSEFGAIAIVTYNPKVASVLVYERFTTYGLDGALPPAALLLGVALAVFVALRALARPLPAPQ
jgi:molybdate/tungstate transport system permease protein